MGIDIAAKNQELFIKHRAVDLLAVPIAWDDA
jgi:hypothetical protein